MVFVVVNEIDGLRLARTGEEEPNLDPLKDRGVRPEPDPFDGGLDLLQAHAQVSRPSLHQQHAAGGNARQERLRGSDLLSGATEVRPFIDHERVGAHLVEGAPGCGGAGRVHPVDDEILASHRVLCSRPRSALRLHAGEESVEVDHKALVRPTTDKLDVIEGRDLEVDAAAFGGNDASGNPHPQTNRGRREVFDAQAGPHRPLSRLQLAGDGENRRRLEAVTENRSGQYRNAGILEPVGTMFGPDHLLETTFLTDTH